MKKFIILSLGLLLTACATTKARNKLLNQVSFDHNCNIDTIKIVSENTEIWGYIVDACGKQRKYRDMGNSKFWQFVDVTDGTPKSLKNSD